MTTHPHLSADQIMEYLPHRYPFLLIDRITEFEAGKSITGIKNVTVNEEFFQGHFPGHSIMPGVLILEAMAQVGGLLLLEEAEEEAERQIVYLAGMQKVRWLQPRRKSHARSSLHVRCSEMGVGLVLLSTGRRVDSLFIPGVSYPPEYPGFCVIFGFAAISSCGIGRMTKGPG